MHKSLKQPTKSNTAKPPYEIQFIYGDVLGFKLRVRTFGYLSGFGFGVGLSWPPIAWALELPPTCPECGRRVKEGEGTNKILGFDPKNGSYQSAVVHTTCVAAEAAKMKAEQDRAMRAEEKRRRSLRSK